MATTTPNREPNSSTPLLAVVGATDLAVKGVRAAVAGASAVQAQIEARFAAAAADVEQRISDFDPTALRSQAQEIPLKAAGRALEAAGKAEAKYEELAKRGAHLVDRVRSQVSTQELIHQAGSTLSRSRAAVTVARKAADDTASALLGTLNVGKREAGVVVTQTGKSVQEATQKTQAAAKKTAAGTRKRAVTTKSAVKGAETSARKTATKATAASRAAVKKVGD